MDITQINSNTSSKYQEQSKPGNSKIGQDGFLRMLVTQMRHQDPTNPMKSQEFASQLAQFSSVEQTTKTNEKLDQLISKQDNMTNSIVNTFSSTLTGKHAKVQTNQLSLEAGSPSNVNFQLGKEASNVELAIKDSAGQTVRTATFENMGAGEHSWQWNGKSNDGTRLSEGDYTVEVSAKSGDSDVQSFAFQEGNIDKVSFSKDGVKLEVNGLNVAMGQVESISDAEEETSGEPSR